MEAKLDWFYENYDDYWLFDKSPRETQIDILKEIDEAINSNYKHIIVHAGVGIGKSAIVDTISNTFDSSYICTKTTNLQNQYVTDYLHLSELKGRGNYICNYLCEDESRFRRCDECYMNYLTKYGTVEEKKEELNTYGRKWEYYSHVSKERYDEIISELPMYPCNNCEYLEAIKIAQYNPHVIANYHSLYFNSVINKRFKPRDAIFFDECHNLEGIAMSVVGFKFSPSPNKFYEKYGINVFDAPESELKSVDYWRNMLMIEHDTLLEQKETYQSQLDNIDIYFNTQINETALKLAINELTNQLISLDYNIDLLDEGMYIDLPPKNKRKIYVRGNGVTFKPILGDKYVKNFQNMGDTCFYFTGTLPVPEYYCECVNLDFSNDVYYTYKKSPYPVENRPIIYHPIDDFTGPKNEYGEYRWQKHRNIGEIKKLLLKHSGENIVIHTTSNDQSEWLYNNLVYEFDCAVASGNADVRNKIINEFKRKDGIFNILISPSIKEGVDFEGDTCTVQIILKNPRRWDNIAQERSKQYSDSDFSNFYTAIPLEQAYGRSIRSESDVSVTYIVDTDFKKWYHYGKRYLSSYFKEAIVWSDV